MIEYNENIEPIKLFISKYYYRMRFVLAIAIIIAATEQRVTPLNPLGTKLAWISFYPAVMAAEIFKVFYAGFFSRALSVLIVLFFCVLFALNIIIKASSYILRMLIILGMPFKEFEMFDLIRKHLYLNYSYEDNDENNFITPIKLSENLDSIILNIDTNLKLMKATNLSEAFVVEEIGEQLYKKDPFLSKAIIKCAKSYEYEELKIAI